MEKGFGTCGLLEREKEEPGKEKHIVLHCTALALQRRLYDWKMFTGTARSVVLIEYCTCHATLQHPFKQPAVFPNRDPPRYETTTTGEAVRKVL